MTLTELQEDVHRAVVLHCMTRGPVYARVPPGFAHAHHATSFRLADRSDCVIKLLTRSFGLGTCYHVSTSTNQFYVLSSI